MNKQSIWLFALSVISLLLVSLVWYNQPEQRQPLSRLLNEPIDCQLHQKACKIQDAQIRIDLDITPKPIPIAKALSVTAHISGILPTRVQLDINGSNMYMGYNRIDLNAQDDGSWTGKSLLAFCTIDKMSWQLTLLIDTPSGEQLQAPFPLVTPYQP